MIKISMPEDEQHRMIAIDGKAMFLWLKIDFRSEKELDVAWSHVWERDYLISLPCTSRAGHEIFALRQRTSSNKKDLYVRIRIDMNNAPDPAQYPLIAKDAAETCKQYIEEVLLDVAIKGDLNTK